MYDNEFAVLMVIAVGLIAGGGVGLVVVTLFGNPRKDWAEIPLKERWIMFVAIAAFIICATAIIAWYTLFP